MPDVSLINIEAQTYDIGRAAIFACNYWNGEGNLFASLQHIGNTEGEASIEPNEEYSALTLPENLGPAALKKYVTGAAPSFSVGVFVNPNSLSLFTPTGAGSMGNMRQRRVKERTIWIVPEQLFIAPDGNGVEQEVDISYDGAAFQKNGQGFSEEDNRLFGLSVFGWKVHFERAMPVYRHEDGGKSLREITVHFMQDLTKPDGHQILTVGAELEGSGVSLGGASS